MGIFLSSADKPRFLATKGFGGGGGGGRVSQYVPCNAFLQCVLSIYPDTLHCKGSQWVTQWVTMLDVHRPHTHTTWVTMGLTMVRGKRGVGWFWTNALFQVVRRPPLLSFCPPMLFTMSSLLLQLFVFCSCCRETPAEFCHLSYICARILWGVFR